MIELSLVVGRGLHLEQLSHRHGGITGRGQGETHPHRLQLTSCMCVCEERERREKMTDDVRLLLMAVYA